LFIFAYSLFICLFVCFRFLLIQLRQPTGGDGEGPRIELFDDKHFNKDKSREVVSFFFSQQSSSSGNSATTTSSTEGSSSRLSEESVATLPENVVSCFGALLSYLRDFGISHILKVRYFAYILFAVIKLSTCAFILLMFVSLLAIFPHSATMGE
jgi:vacuolar-type H+-ATPase subunit I/STV1